MKAFLLSTTLLTAGSILLGADARPADQALAKRAAAIKPAAEELLWQQIPWVLDLNEGIRLAREEKRPLLLWVSGDDPLERC